MVARRIEIPKGLTEDEFREFIREEVRKVGGDPDTLYPVDFSYYDATPSDHVEVPVLENFEVKLNYDYFRPSDYPIDVDITIVEHKDPNYESVKKVMEMWTKAIQETENGLEY